MNYPLKILFLVDDFPPVTYTSSGKVVLGLAEELARRGHKVFVITSVQKKSQEGEEILGKLKIFRVYSNYHERWQAWLSLYNPQTVFKVREIIKKIKPDIVNSRHIHQYLSYHCFKIAKKYSKVVFLTANDCMLFGYTKVVLKNGECVYRLGVRDYIKQVGKRYNPFRNIIIHHYLKYIDKIFSISNTLKKALEINGIKNIITIYNGIDVNEWQENKSITEKFKQKYNLQGKKIVLFGGRLGESKGGKVILEAMGRVTKEIDNAVLLVTGKKDSYAQTMMGVARDLAIEDKVIFTGFIIGEELKAAYHSADVCTLPSIYLEAFGMTGLEVMASGRPLIGSCFGGIHEMIVDGKTGYVVNPFNTEDFAGKIIDLLKNPQKAKEFGEAGYERAKTEFSLEKKADETLEQYYKFLSHLNFSKQKQGKDNIKNSTN